MKKRHLDFFLAVSLVVGFFSVFPELGGDSGEAMSRAEFWRSVLGPLSMILAALLAAAAIAGWRGSAIGWILCVAWAAIYSLLLGGLGMWHFPQPWHEGMWYFPAWSAAWSIGTWRWMRDDMRNLKDRANAHQ